MAQMDPFAPLSNPRPSLSKMGVSCPLRAPNTASAGISFLWGSFPTCSDDGWERSDAPPEPQDGIPEKRGQEGPQSISRAIMKEETRRDPPSLILQLVGNGECLNVVFEPKDGFPISPSLWLTFPTALTRSGKAWLGLLITLSDELKKENFLLISLF